LKRLFHPCVLILLYAIFLGFFMEFRKYYETAENAKIFVRIGMYILVLSYIRYDITKNNIQIGSLGKVLTLLLMPISFFFYFIKTRGLKQSGKPILYFMLFLCIWLGAFVIGDVLYSAFDHWHESTP
jgi:hypothetical protein